MENRTQAALCMLCLSRFIPGAGHAFDHNANTLARQAEEPLLVVNEIVARPT